MKCPGCQAENPPGMRFCGQCAAPLAAVCPSCGTANPPGNKFCGQCATPLDGSKRPRFSAPEAYTPKHLAERIINSKTALEGERKHVTVLFADLKGSTELLADRDPEEARKLLDPVLEHMMEAVHRYEGTVNQVMGDGIMALFGAPLAHEDHAVRACYAALRMQETVKRYADGVFRTYGVPVRIRVGLNSGEVVVRSIGSDLHMDYTAVGQTTHLAARMEQIADPGTIRMTSDTLHLAEGFVEVQALGSMPVKGLPALIDVYELTGASSARSRLHVSAARGLTTFVGRDAEMDRLFAALEQAQAGHGQIVAVVGEPGVGKSRLYWEFTRSHRTDGCLVLQAPSVSYGKATTYLPVIELLKRYVGIDPRDDARKIRERVTGKLFSLDRALEPCLSPLLWLLDAPVEEPTWERLDSLLRRQRLRDAIRHLLLREAREQPLILVFEDLHWIDDETQTLLDGLVESLPATRMLLLVNYRPEYRHGWGSKTFYTQVRLDALPPASATELLGTLLGSHASVQPLVPLLIARTEGNPFFLEETVHSLVEAQALTGDRGAYRLLRAPEALTIPSTARAILSARIDRLAPEDKRLLQTAAVIGKDVPYPLLEAIAELDSGALRAGLARLQEVEFLYEVRLFPDLEYTFKHALTHEVAYASLIGDRRRSLHLAVFTAIEQLHADRLTEHVEQLADHAVRGRLHDRAIPYLRQAAEKAASRSAHRQAAEYCLRALAELQHIPTARERLEEALDIRFNLRNNLVVLGESDRVLENLREVERLAEQLGDRRRLGWVWSYMSAFCHQAGQLQPAKQLASQACAFADTVDDLSLRVSANFQLGWTATAIGEFALAETVLLANVERLSHRHRERAGLGGFAVVMCRSWLAHGQGEQGKFAEGTALGLEGMRLAEELEHPFSFSLMASEFAHLQVIKGDFAEAVRLLERAGDIATQYNLGLILPRIMGYLGRARAYLSSATQGVELLEQAQAMARSTPIRHADVAINVFLGEAHLLAGRVKDALATGTRAEELARERGERAYQAWALRLMGEAILYGDRSELDSAASGYRQAFAVATELGMRPLVAHCHLGLGKLYRCTGKREQARENLTTAATMYRDMGMTYWLEKAEAELT